jgi:hypothetical protein
MVIAIMNLESIVFEHLPSTGLHVLKFSVLSSLCMEESHVLEPFDGLDDFSYVREVYCRIGRGCENMHLCTSTGAEPHLIR